MLAPAVRTRLARKESDRSTHNSFARYASGYRVHDRGTFTLVEVTDPWQQSKDVIFSYVLAENPGELPDSLTGIPFIKTPVKRVIVLSTTHVAMIEQLGSASSIVGLSGSDFVYSPRIRAGYCFRECEGGGLRPGTGFRDDC